MRRALVVGAGGALGEAIAHELLARGWSVDARMRRPHRQVQDRLIAAGARVDRLDLHHAAAFGRALDACDAVIFCPILTLSALALPALRDRPNVGVIFFSSNNVSFDPDTPVYRAILAAEARVRDALPTSIILRPTLIYGDPRLTTIPNVMRVMRRLPVFPMPGCGGALQQPVHVKDLARVAAEALETASVQGRTFALGGPDILPARAFYAAIMCALDLERPMVSTPRLALRAARALLGKRFPLDAAQIARVDKDRCADVSFAPPANLRPRTPLADGLRDLARALGHVKSNT